MTYVYTLDVSNTQQPLLVPKRTLVMLDYLAKDYIK